MENKDVQILKEALIKSILTQEKSSNKILELEEQKERNFRWYLEEKEKAENLENQKVIKLSLAETESNFNRVNFAEKIILQLPIEHEGRNTWLLNFGKTEEAENLRHEKGLTWNKQKECATKVL